MEWNTDSQDIQTAIDYIKINGLSFLQRLETPVDDLISMLHIEYLQAVRDGLSEFKQNSDDLSEAMYGAIYRVLYSLEYAVNNQSPYSSKTALGISVSRRSVATSASIWYQKYQELINSDGLQFKMSDD